MSSLNVKSTIAGLVAAVLAAASPTASSVASAQDAIMLETIGAVRMAQPDEVRSMAAECENAHREPQAQSHTEQEAAAR